MEEDKDKAALDWAEQEEKRELEAMKAEAANSKSANQDPTKDPENVAWMDEQIQKAKEIYGESFGEDIELDFDE